MGLCSKIYVEGKHTKVEAWRLFQTMRDTSEGNKGNFHVRGAKPIAKPALSERIKSTTYEFARPVIERAMTASA